MIFEKNCAFQEAGKQKSAYKNLSPRTFYPPFLKIPLTSSFNPPFLKIFLRSPFGPLLKTYSPLQKWGFPAVYKEEVWIGCFKSNLLIMIISIILSFQKPLLLCKTNLLKHVGWSRTCSMEAQAKINHGCDWDTSLSLWRPILKCVCYSLDLLDNFGKNRPTLLMV